MKAKILALYLLNRIINTIRKPVLTGKVTREYIDFLRRKSQ